MALGLSTRGAMQGRQAMGMPVQLAHAMALAARLAPQRSLQRWASTHTHWWVPVRQQARQLAVRRALGLALAGCLADMLVRR
jgi:hypothetical protein